MLANSSVDMGKLSDLAMIGGLRQAGGCRGQQTVSYRAMSQKRGTGGFMKILVSGFAGAPSGRARLLSHGSRFSYGDSGFKVSRFASSVLETTPKKGHVPATRARGAPDRGGLSAVRVLLVGDRGTRGRP